MIALEARQHGFRRANGFAPAARLMGAVAVEVHMLLGGASALATIAAMLAAGISYIILLPLLGVLNRQELCQLPVVKRFLK